MSRWIKCENGDYLNSEQVLSITFKEQREGGFQVCAMTLSLKKMYPIKTVETKQEAQATIDELISYLDPEVMKH